jgi:hypothetical protein
VVYKGVGNGSYNDKLGCTRHRSRRGYDILATSKKTFQKRKKTVALSRFSVYIMYMEANDSFKKVDKMTRAECYRIGKETSEMSYEDIIYGGLIDGDIFDSMVLTAFFEAGRNGCEMPYKITGWRYGDVPACGCSSNYREGTKEFGVSLMQVDGEEEVKSLCIFNPSVVNRPKIRVEGWRVTHTTGGDGESLVVGAKAI